MQLEWAACDGASRCVHHRRTILRQDEDLIKSIMVMAMRIAALEMHKRVSLLLAAIGAVLMIGKIYADGEPGLIPLVLLVAGVAWYCLARFRRWGHPG